MAHRNFFIIAALISVVALVCSTTLKIRSALASATERILEAVPWLSTDTPGPFRATPEGTAVRDDLARTREFQSRRLQRLSRSRAHAPLQFGTAAIAA